MTDLDKTIKNIFEANGIKIFPCKPMPSGQLQVGDVTSLYNCVVETYLDEEDLENGMVRLRSGFYMFMLVKKETDIMEDVNPKQELLTIMCRKVIKQLQRTKYMAKLDGKLIAGIYNTTALETGKSFTMIFEYMPYVNV